MSPFCVKLETYLRMAKIPYRVKFGTPMSAPKGRIPYIELRGEKLGDSSLIIARLKREFGDPLDSRLSPEQRAQSTLLQALFEDRIYWPAAYLRWADDHSWKHVQDVFKPMVPKLLGPFVLKKIRKTFLTALQATGMGDHDRETVVEIARDALTAASVALGTKPYFLGSEPASIDATAYGFLLQQMDVPWESELTQHAKSLSNLVAYRDRMRERYWAG